MCPITTVGTYLVMGIDQAVVNCSRYYDKIITDVTGYGKFWQTLATPYKNNQYVIFDTNNECE